MKDAPVEAEVEREISNGYRLKVSMPTLGMYVWGFRATHSNKNSGKWWIQPPAIQTSPRVWKCNPEFDKDKPLWLEIEKVVLDAIDMYEKNSNHEYIVGPDEEVSDATIAKSYKDIFDD